MCQLRIKGSITQTAPTAPLPSMSRWVALAPCFPSLLLSPAAICVGLRCPSRLPGLRDHAQHRETSLELEHRSGLARFYFTFTFTDSSSPSEKKGRLRLPGRKAGLMGAAQSWALRSFQLGNCPVSQGPSWSDGI